MHKPVQFFRFLFVLVSVSLLVACSGADATPEPEEPPEQSTSFQADAGPPMAVVAGNPIELHAATQNGEIARCTWTIVEPAARYAEEDAGLVLSEECAYTIPGDFTTERTGLWTVELAAVSTDNETSTDQVNVRVTPNTVNLLILGYIVIFAVAMLFIGSMVWCAHTLHREAAALETLVGEK